MDENELLKATSLYFRDTVPGITPEGVQALLLLGARGSLSLSDLAAALRRSPADTKAHLAALMAGTGAGLIAYTMPGSGSTAMGLTTTGNTVMQGLRARLGQA